MRVREITRCCLSHMLLFIVIVLSRFPTIRCLDEDDYRQNGDPALLSSVTQIVNGRLTNMTRIMSNDIGTNWGFCVKDLDSDWNGAFNYQGNIGFLTSCIKKTKGDLTQRLCTAAELRFFFSSFSTRGPSSGITYTYIKPNKNCNLTSWVSGCEPGWSCSVGKNNKVDLKSTSVPTRRENCQSCCEGFFCPRGLTCMIRNLPVRILLSSCRAE